MQSDTTGTSSYPPKDDRHVIILIINQTSHQPLSSPPDSQVPTSAKFQLWFPPPTQPSLSQLITLCLPSAGSRAQSAVQCAGRRGSAGPGRTPGPHAVLHAAACCRCCRCSLCTRDAHARRNAPPSHRCATFEATGRRHTELGGSRLIGARSPVCSRACVRPNPPPPCPQLQPDRRNADSVGEGGGGDHGRRAHQRYF